MNKRIYGLISILVVGLVALVAIGQEDGPGVTPQVAPKVAPQVAPQVAPKIVEEGVRAGIGTDPGHKPTYDKPTFIKSAHSVARGDLLSCRNTEAQVENPSHASANALAKAIHGVWINRNGRTVHGRVVETDTVWYIQMNGLRGEAILLDRNNMGLDTLTAPFVAGGEYDLTQRTRERLKIRPRRPLSWKYVNCTYEMVDEYVKVSDEVVLEALAATTPVDLPEGGEGMPLRQAWEQLKAAGWFDVLDIPTTYEGGKALKVDTQLGDTKRWGFTPEGVKVTEQMVIDGLAPGAEYELPMQVGAYFDIEISEIEDGPGGYRSVWLHMDAEYSGTGVNLVPSEPHTGIEEGEFVMEGNAFVSARSVSGDRCYGAGTCGTINGLGELADGSEGATAQLRRVPGKDGLTFLSAELFFERVIIGLP